jgi:hypothetical protein
MISERLTAALLCALLVSCAATQPSAPPRAEELAHHVLVIQELPDGRVTHSWRRAEEFDLKPYSVLSGTRGTARHIVPAVARPRDCDEENEDCVEKCVNRPIPRGFGHITSSRGRAGKAEYCRDQCRQAHLDCMELERLRPQEFTAADGAIDWLKRHRKSLLVGSGVIIAGVAFVVVSAGAGLVILAPAVLLAAPAAPPEPFMAEIAP